MQSSAHGGSGANFPGNSGQFRAIPGECADVQKLVLLAWFPLVPTQISCANPALPKTPKVVAQGVSLQVAVNSQTKLAIDRRFDG